MNTLKCCASLSLCSRDYRTAWTSMCDKLHPSLVALFARILKDTPAYYSGPPLEWDGNAAAFIVISLASHYCGLALAARPSLSAQWCPWDYDGRYDAKSNGEFILVAVDGVEVAPYQARIHNHRHTMTTAQRLQYTLLLYHFARYSRAVRCYTLYRPEMFTEYGDLYVYTGSPQSGPAADHVYFDELGWLSLDDFMPIDDVCFSYQTKDLFAFGKMRPFPWSRLVDSLAGTPLLLPVNERWKRRNRLMMQILEPLIQLADTLDARD